MYQNYKDIKLAKRLCEQLALDLHERYLKQTTYREKLPDGSFRRPVIVIKSQEQLDDVIAVREQIAEIRQRIMDSGGGGVRFTEPRIIENVLLYKVWVNTERSSSFSQTSRAEILHNLKQRLARLQLAVDNDIAEVTSILLRKEIRFFESETEEFYRARSIGMPSSFAELHLANHGLEQVKISEAGLFVVGANFDTPRADFPTGRKPRKARATIYDDLERIQYSGAVNSVLYRESEVVAAKKKAGFDEDAQENIKNTKKDVSRRSPGAPPEHPI